MTDIESLSEFTIMADTSYVAAEYVPVCVVFSEISNSNPCSNHSLI